MQDRKRNKKSAPSIDDYIKAVDKTIHTKTKKTKNLVERVPGEMAPIFAVLGKDGKRYIARPNRGINWLDLSYYTFYDVESGDPVRGWWNKRKLGIVKRLGSHLNGIRAEISNELRQERKKELNEYCKAVEMITHLEKENEQ